MRGGEWKNPTRKDVQTVFSVFKTENPLTFEGLNLLANFQLFDLISVWRLELTITRSFSDFHQLRLIECKLYRRRLKLQDRRLQYYKRKWGTAVPHFLLNTTTAISRQELFPRNSHIPWGLWSSLRQSSKYRKVIQLFLAKRRRIFAGTTSSWLLKHW